MPDYDLDEQMLGAVMDGDGLAGIAELAAGEIGGPVAILLPARELAASWPADIDTGGLISWAADSLAGRDVQRPPTVRQSVPVRMPGADLGRVVAIDDAPEPRAEAEPALRSAALATLGQLAAIDARDRLSEELRGGFIEELREGGLQRAEVLRKARRLGCDLSDGTVAIVAESSGGKPRYMAAIISSTAAPAITQPLGQRVFALLGAPGSEAAAVRASEAVERLRRHGPAAASSFYPDPGDAPRALEEAELMLEIVARDPRLSGHLEGGVPTGVYRLLFRALASNPAEVMRFYEDTVAVLVHHDHEQSSDLVETLEAYLSNDGNMRATAESVYAHRQTVAHRLRQISELCGLDPSSADDRERLGLGIKAFRLIEPTLSSQEPLARRQTGGGAR